MQLENLVANALSKELYYLQDTQDIKTNLHFLHTKDGREKDGREIDCLIYLDDKPFQLIEVKSSNGD